MPGPGAARDRSARGGMFRDAPAAGTPAAGLAAARLREGLDGWRRYIWRRRSAAAARRWSLITLGTALAGVAAGRLDGNMLVTAVAATALALLAGAVSAVNAVRRRRVCAEDAARHLDAVFGFDEQVATALCCAQAGTAGVGGSTEHNRLVAELIERAAVLVAETGGVPRPRPVPAYGEWAAMAVTAAAVAAVAAVPGPAPSTSATAAGGPGRASPLASATAVPRPAPRPTRAGGVTVGSTGTPDATVTSGHRPAPTATGASPENAPGGRTRPTAPTTGSAPTAKTGASTSHGTAGAAATAGAGTAGGRSASASAGGPGQRGPAPPAAGQSRAGQSRGATTRHGRTQSAAARRATGSRGSAAHSGGLPGGLAAGTEPGNDRTSARPAEPLPSAGNTVLLIVLPGGDGTVTTGQGAPGQPEGSGGISTSIVTATASENGAEYVPPDQNEVPFPDQGLLGRYF